MKVREIIEQRIDSITRWLDSEKPGKATDRANLKDTLVRFSLFLDGESADWEIDELERILEENNRAKTQAIQFMFVEFLSETGGKERYKYKLVEFLATAGRNYPPVFYKYLNHESELRSEIAETLDYDSRFLPILFRQIIPSRSATTQFYQANSLQEIGHRLRIMQLLYFDWKNDKKYAETAPLQIDFISFILEKLFNYQESVTRAIIAELEVFELCLVKRNGELDEMSDYNGVRILPKGRYLLDDFVFYIAYLNLNAMRLLLPKWMFEMGIIRTAQRPVDLHGDERRQGIRSWVLAKIVNSAIILGLLGALDSIQLHQAQTVLSNEVLDVRYQRILAQMFKELSNWHWHIEKEIDDIMHSMDETGILSDSEIVDAIKGTTAKINKYLAQLATE